MLCIEREVDAQKPTDEESQLYDFSDRKVLLKVGFFGGGGATTQGQNQTPNEETKGAAAGTDNTTMGNMTMDQSYAA